MDSDYFLHKLQYLHIFPTQWRCWQYIGDLMAKMEVIRRLARLKLRQLWQKGCRRQDCQRIYLQRRKDGLLLQRLQQSSHSFISMSNAVQYNSIRQYKKITQSILEQKFIRCQAGWVRVYKLKEVILRLVKFGCVQTSLQT